MFQDTDSVFSSRSLCLLRMDYQRLIVRQPASIPLLSSPKLLLGAVVTSSVPPLLEKQR